MTHTQHHALHYLVELRTRAREDIKTQRLLRHGIEQAKARVDVLLAMGAKKAVMARHREHIAAMEGLLVDIRFDIIKVGETFTEYSEGWDRDLPREMWLRALGVNESEWHTDQMREYGDTILNVVSVLNLENSATKDEDIALRPLNWAFTMFMMNASKTNAQIGKAMHEKANELFDGAMGQWREPTLLERLGAA